MNMEIISKLTHELKNPLSVCNGYLEMIKNSDEESKEKYLQIIKSEIKRSLNILSNYSNKKLNIEKIDLIEFYKDIKNLFDLYFLKHNTKLSILNSEKIYIEGDYNKLKQVLINIIKNSYEAKKYNSKLLITIKTISLENKIKIIIRDNGCGMNDNELQRIYENYYTTKENGNGIGIPYIKEIITLHNGIVKYYSKKNIGTKVIIELPKKSPKTF